MIPSFAVTVIGLLLAAPADSRQAVEKIDLSNVSLPAELVAPQIKPAAAAVVCFLEGPAVDAEGNVFSATSLAMWAVRRLSRMAVTPICTARLW